MKHLQDHDLTSIRTIARDLGSALDFKINPRELAQQKPSTLTQDERQQLRDARRAWRAARKAKTKTWRR